MMGRLVRVRVRAKEFKGFRGLGVRG